MNQFMIVKIENSILSLSVGIGLVLLVVISYLAIWHPRVSKKHWVTQQSPWRDVFGSIPWILIITYAGIAVMAVIAIVHYAYHPPNW